MNIKLTTKKVRLNILSSLLAGTLLVSGCSSSSNINNNNENSIQTGDLTATDSNVTESTVALPETSETTEAPKKYDIMWGDTASKDFSDYLEKKVGINLRTYVRYFGFTEELEIIYSEYMGENYGTDGMVSFQTSNYFFTYIDNYGGESRRFYREYQRFSARYFDKDNCLNGSFANKFIMSYLCQNNLKFGYMIPTDYFESVNKDYINLSKKFDVDFYWENMQLGNYDNGYKYSSDEMIALMILYNNNLCYMYYSESVKDHDLLSEPEAVEAFNQNLKQYYGANAPQIGQVVTVEQYRAMFGEDPLDLSYIPGAVYDETT